MRLLKKMENKKVDALSYPKIGLNMILHQKTLDGNSLKTT